MSNMWLGCKERGR